jgi:segregation and condensation protein B
MHPFSSPSHRHARMHRDSDTRLTPVSAISINSGEEFRRYFFRHSERQSVLIQGATNDAPFWRTPKMARLEAALFVADTATSPRKLTQLATLVDVAETRLLIDRLNASYDETGSSFRIERVATGYRMLTRPEFSPWLNRLHHRQSELKLSAPALETLTLVAYLQPITRADVESIRGVQCTEMLKQLMERNLVRIAGEENSLGRPYLYGTTRNFLELFGLRTLDDLPMAENLRRIKPPANQPESPATPTEATETDADPETPSAPLQTDKAA